jgi:hypothetical protein
MLKPQRKQPAFRRSFGIVLGRGRCGPHVSNSHDLESNVPSGADGSAPRVLRDAPAQVPRAQQGGTGRAPYHLCGCTEPDRKRPLGTGRLRQTPTGAADSLQPILGCEGPSTDHPHGCDRFGPMPTGRQRENLDYSSEYEGYDLQRTWGAAEGARNTLTGGKGSVPSAPRAPRPLNREYPTG